MDEDLIEWDYGVYEGRTTANIRAELGDPHWSVFNSTEGLGETVNEVGMRADAVLSRVVPTINAGRNVVLIAHSHLLRILAARWLDLPPDRGRSFALAPAASATLGFERDTPAVLQWNVTV
jgi:probable phosphoglycerate mutase